MISLIHSFCKENVSLLLQPRLTFYFSCQQNYVDLDTVDIILLQNTQTSFIGQ